MNSNLKAFDARLALALLEDRPPARTRSVGAAFRPFRAPRLRDPVDLMYQDLLGEITSAPQPAAE